MDWPPRVLLFCLCRRSQLTGRLRWREERGRVGDLLPPALATATLAATLRPLRRLRLSSPSRTVGANNIRRGLPSPNRSMDINEFCKAAAAPLRVAGAGSSNKEPAQWPFTSVGGSPELLPGGPCLTRPIPRPFSRPAGGGWEEKQKMERIDLNGPEVGRRTEPLRPAGKWSGSSELLRRSILQLNWP